MVPKTHVLMANVQYTVILQCCLSFSISDKFLYCRLSPNHKVLHYGDVEDLSQGQIPHEALQEKCENVLYFSLRFITFITCNVRHVTVSKKNKNKCRLYTFRRIPYLLYLIYVFFTWKSGYT